MAVSLSAGRLYLVPSTLDFGTLKDGEPPPPLNDTLPAGTLRIAAGLTHWIAENAKTTRALLKRLDAIVPLSQPLQALQIQELPRRPKGAAPHRAQPADLRAMLTPALAGHDIGLVSEAGLPAVADPGAQVVEAAHALGLPVQPLSGPSALLLALAASGFNGQSFAFVGYLPTDASAREQRLRALETRSAVEAQTQLVIETPYRNAALLAAMTSALKSTTRMSVSCGLTLEGGWTRSDTVADWRARPAALPDRVPAVFALLAARH